MRMGGGNPNRHWHHWVPLDNRTETIKRCSCGATREWRSIKWVVRKPRVKKPPVV